MAVVGSMNWVGALVGCDDGRLGDVRLSVDLSCGERWSVSAPRISQIMTHNLPRDSASLSPSSTGLDRSPTYLLMSPQRCPYQFLQKSFTLLCL